MTSAPALRVALLAPCFWPEVRRGGERLVRDLADGLIDRGQRPLLLTSHRGLRRSSVEDGLPIRRSWRPPDGLLRRRGFEDHLTHLPATALALRGEAPDLAHAFYPTDALVAARWSRRSGRPAVQTYLGLPTRRWLTARRLRLEVTQAASEGCTTVAISRAAADEFERTLGLEVRVIHPGVDLSAFTPGSVRAPEPTVFCAAAIDQPQKRVDLLVEAFRVLRRRHPDARLVLSRPPGRRECAALADEAGIELRDLDRHDELLRSYREAWVTALPSRGEAFGLVLAESLACGTPVVGARDGAIPEVVDSPEVGVLFDADLDALTAALEEALGLAADVATGERCRRRAQAFSLDRSVDAYLELYAELLDRG